MGASDDKVRAEGRIAALAARQYGRVHRSQLLDAGLTHRQIARRTENGTLHRTFRSVYAVGHIRDDRWARWSEALLALGPGAALSHTTAAALWRIRHTTERTIHVTIQGTTKRNAPPDVRVHRTTRAETTTRNHLTLTSLARTLRDAGSLISRRERDEMLHQADQRWQIRPREVERVLGRGRPGAAGLRRAYEDRLPAALLTRSSHERAFLHLCHQAGLPLPLVNQTVAGLEVDFFWPDHGLIVEIDTVDFHGSPQAMKRDRERDTHLRLQGFAPPTRFLDEQLEETPRRVTHTVAQLLATVCDNIRL